MSGSGQSAMDALAAKQAKLESDVQELEKRVRVSSRMAWTCVLSYDVCVLLSMYVDL